MIPRRHNVWSPCGKKPVENLLTDPPKGEIISVSRLWVTLGIIAPWIVDGEWMPWGRISNRMAGGDNLLLYPRLVHSS